MGHPIDSEVLHGKALSFTSLPAGIAAHGAEQINPVITSTGRYFFGPHVTTIHDMGGR